MILLVSSIKIFRARKKIHGGIFIKSLLFYLTHLSSFFLLLSSCGQVAPLASPSLPAVTSTSQPPEAAIVSVETVNDFSLPSVVGEKKNDTDKQASIPTVETEEITQEILAHMNLQKANVELDKSVQDWIRYFTNEGRERFEEYIKRGSKYKDFMQQILQDNELPQELFYIGLIESGYANTARSLAKAVGIWQFVPGTGKKYNLQIDQYVDERRDPIRSTEAAVKYLKHLYTAFQSWELAMAAYNCGEYRVLSAIMNGNSRNFWELVERKLLPKETRNYVPKFIAATIIGENLEQYGIALPETAPLPDLVAISVPAPVALGQFANVTGVNLETLVDFNPHLLKKITPPGRDSYELWIPLTMEKQVSEKIAQVQRMTVPVAVKQVGKRDSSFYSVKKGDNLGLIARKFNVSIRYLQKLNNLVKAKIYIGQKLRINSHQLIASKVTTYKVRRGDILEKISKKFGITIAQIKKINRLRNHRIYPGQILKIEQLENI